MRPAFEPALRTAGFHVIVPGDDAPVLPGELAPQMVVLDADRAGECEALITCRALRASPGGTEAPALLLISVDDAGVVERGLEAGVTDFGIRTAPAALLTHRVRQMLRVKHTVDDLHPPPESGSYALVPPGPCASSGTPKGSSARTGRNSGPTIG